MTLPSVVRVFFAVDLPPETKEALYGFMGKVKKRAKSHAIRWTKPENLHVTLQFLAEVRSEHIDAVIQEVSKLITQAAKSTKLTFGEVTVFPNPYRPRVIVLNIEPQEELAALSAIIGKGIQAANYAIEDRPFRAHLTIGRIKQPQGVDLRFLHEFNSPGIEDIEVNEVVLFRSEPQAEGSQYTVLERIALKEGCRSE